MKALYEKKYIDRNGKPRTIAAVTVNENAAPWFQNLMAEIAEQVEARMDQSCREEIGKYHPE